jgi:hypothetical protein
VEVKDHPYGWTIPGHIEDAGDAAQLYLSCRDFERSYEGRHDHLACVVHDELEGSEL